MKAQIEAILTQALDVFNNKTQDYGSPDVGLNVEGGFVWLWGKINRLKSLVWDNELDYDDKQKVLTTYDTLLDILVYCAITLAILQNEMKQEEGLK